MGWRIFPGGQRAVELSILCPALHPLLPPACWRLTQGTALPETEGKCLKVAATAYRSCFQVEPGMGSVSLPACQRAERKDLQPVGCQRGRICSLWAGSPTSTQCQERLFSFVSRRLVNALFPQPWQKQRKNLEGVPAWRTNSAVPSACVCTGTQCR